MTRIEIHLTYDENGKAYNLCNKCGTRYRYKGGSGFCKPECQTEWNKIRDATSRAARIKRNREAEIEQAARDMERIAERLKIKQEIEKMMKRNKRDDEL